MLEIKTLYDGTGAPPSPCLTKILHEAYDGDLLFSDSSKRPLIFGNFVQTLDGIVSLKIPGKSGGAEISGRNEEDAFIMGMLRAYADAVMFGEDTFRNAPGHVWTAGCVYPHSRKISGLSQACGQRRSPSSERRGQRHGPCRLERTIV